MLVGSEETEALFEADIAEMGMPEIPVAEALARLLDAPLIMPQVSRLVCDCNRPHGSAGATPARSEIYEIPGNRDLTLEQREARARRFYEPFREAVDRTLRHRLQSCGAAILVTIHSFTPIFKGKARDIQLGILHDADSRLADAVLEIVEKEAGLIVGRNQPYGPEEGVTKTLRFWLSGFYCPNITIKHGSIWMDKLRSC